MARVLPFQTYVYRRPLQLQLCLLLAPAIALSLSPERAEAQVRSAIATVQLTAVVPPGVRFGPASGSGVVPSGSTGTSSQAFSLTVNAPYRLQVRRAWGSGGSAPGAILTLPAERRPAPLRLEAVRERIEAAGLGDEGLPVTVDLLLDASL